MNNESEKIPDGPPYEGLPEIDLETFIKHVKEFPFIPTEEMLNEDWFACAPKKEA